MPGIRGMCLSRCRCRHHPFEQLVRAFQVVGHLMFSSKWIKASPSIDRNQRIPLPSKSAPSLTPGNCLREAGCNVDLPAGPKAGVAVNVRAAAAGRKQGDV